MKYAADTSVSVEKSRAEIERTVQRWGANQFMYGWDNTRAIVGFVMKNRQLRFNLDMPDRNAKEFLFTPARRTRRTDAQAYEAWEQACRQRWRALNLVIKAKLEAVESGISTFDAEFLAQLVLPNGQTVGEAVTPRIIEGIENNAMPSLLPDFGMAAIEA
jgi:phospholipase/lecithinase/hemolysin